MTENGDVVSNQVSGEEGLAGRTMNVLAIAGTDPTGGAGIQADLKAIAAGGGYGMAVVTALVAQNTRGVREVHVPPVEFLRTQLDAVSDDVRIDAVKIGMLANAAIIETVAEWLLREKPPIVVLDPVMIAKSGDALLEPEAVTALLKLIPLAHLITPNIPELASIIGEAEAHSWEEVVDQARRVAATYGVSVLAKGGHLAGPDAPDALVRADGTATEFSASRIDTSNTHGTGCSLSSGIAVRAARCDGDWDRAVAEAKRWLFESIATADLLEVGEGNGPVNHFAGLWSRGGLETTQSAEEICADWWNRIEATRNETDETGFLQQLADGSLKREDFLHYVAQDSLFLRDYAKALAQLSAMAPTPEAQLFWAQSAQSAIVGELELHRMRLGGTLDAATLPSDTTAGYINHFLASCSRGYAEAAAAVLPCFWMYADIGARMIGGDFGAQAQDPEHPYAEWLQTYDDPGFAEATAVAVRLTGEAAQQASPEERERMWRAFETSARWERAFFVQTAAQ